MSSRVGIIFKIVSCIAELFLEREDVDDMQVDSDSGAEAIPENGLYDIQSRALSVASDIRRWAPELLATRPAEKPAIEDALNFLDSVQLALTPSGMCRSSTIWGHKVFSTVFMLKSLLLSRSLRRASALASVVKKALHLILPETLSQPIIRMVEDKSISMPSQSTLSRFQVVLDTSFMRLCRQQNAMMAAVSGCRPARFFMVDSSEQCGTDWMISSYTEVPGDALLGLSQALDYLAHTKSAARAKAASVTANSDGGGRDSDAELSDEDMQAVDEVARCEDVVASAIVIHTLPPVAMGSGASSMGHKLHGLLHQMRLENIDWQEVRKIAGTIVSFTTDMGAELGLFSARSSIDLSALVPGFSKVDFVPDCDDIDGGLDVAGGGDADAVPPCALGLDGDDSDMPDAIIAAMLSEQSRSAPNESHNTNDAVCDGDSLAACAS